MSRRKLWLSLLLLLLLSPPLSAQPALAGPEITIPASEKPYDVRLVSHSDGSFTVVWEVGLKLRARRFDARSVPLTGEILLGESSGFDAAALGDGFVVAGLDDRDLYPRVLGRIFDAQGKPRGAPFLVDLAASPALSAPQVAPSPDGGFSVAWTGRDARLGRRIAFLRRFSSTGVPQGKAVRMTDPGFSGDFYDADVVRAPDGRLLVTWSGLGHAGGQLLGPAGERLGGPFSLGAPNLHPAVAFTADGGFAAAWIGGGIFGRLHDRNGSPRSAPFTLETGAQALSAPVLAADPHGRLFAAWSSSPSGLRVVEIGPDGSPGPLLARPNHFSTGTPLAVAAWGDGDLAVSWGQSESGTWGLGLQRFATRSSPGTFEVETGLTAGLEAGGPFTVRVERREGNRGAVSVRYSVRSNLARPGEDFLPVSGIVAFADGESNPETIEIPVLDDGFPEGEEPLVLTLSEPAGGAGLGSPRQARIDIRDDDAPCPLLVSAEAPFDLDPGSTAPYARVGNPRVAGLAGGGFVATWETWSNRFQLSPGHGSALYDASGQRIAILLWPFSGGGSLRLAAHWDGGFTMMGEAYDLSVAFGAPLGAFGVNFDSSGVPLTRAYPLARNPDAIAPAKDGGLFALESSSGAISLVRYRKRGQRAGSPLAVTLEGGASALASDATGRGIVAWGDGPKGSRRLRVRRVDAAGQWLGAAVAADPLPDRRPGQVAVAAAPDGRFVVVWEGFHDTGGFGIFGRRFGASGQPLGPVFLVNSRTAGDQTAPRVAIEGDGRFLVTWQGPAGSGMPKLYGQYFSAGGSRLGGEMLMGVEDPNVPELDASLSGGAAGHYALVWVRPGLPIAITGRRLTAPGEE